MEYDFDTPTHRRGTNSYKWDSSTDKDILPMWVADMDFKTAPCIIEALKERVDHGIFGYTRVPDEYYDAVTGWFSRRHGWKIESDWILYTSGVVPAVSAVIKGLTSPGKKIVTLTPAYNCFFSSIRNNGCLLASCPLKYEDNRFYIDFDCLEALLADPDTTILLLCNPHNPSGRVWTKEELLRIGHLCLKHGVMVVSDEIHCELVHPGHEYTPFASLAKEFSENCVTCVSPSKAFNIAGLQIASIITENNDWRQRIDRAININEVCDVNPFGVIALQAAYSDEGYEWLTQLRAYISANYDLLCERFARELPKCKVMRMEGTYLAWIDCSELHIPSDEIEEMLMHENKVWVNAGSMYGAEGAAFIRVNMACTSELLNEGITRIVNGLGAY